MNIVTKMEVECFQQTKKHLVLVDRFKGTFPDSNAVCEEYRRRRRQGKGKPADVIKINGHPYIYKWDRLHSPEAPYLG